LRIETAVLFTVVDSHLEIGILDDIHRNYYHSFTLRRGEQLRDSIPDRSTNNGRLNPGRIATISGCSIEVATVVRLIVIWPVVGILCMSSG
jgi:hypothetical protein